MPLAVRAGGRAALALRSPCGGRLRAGKAAPCRTQINVAGYERPGRRRNGKAGGALGGRRRQRVRRRWRAWPGGGWPPGLRRGAREAPAMT